MLDAEILEGFKEETGELLSELEGVIDDLESVSIKDPFPKVEIEKFAQIIDRVMGAANTIHQMGPESQGFQVMGKLSGLCKALGYKASELAEPALVPLFAGFFADTLEALQELNDALDDPSRVQEVTEGFAVALQKRLEWLAGKVVEMTKNKPGSEAQSQIQVDALLKSFGI
jgi:hypothetical protein